MITQNTGTTANSGSQVTTQAITIPAGVFGGDVVLMKADIIVLTAIPPTITASSTGTSPILAGSEDSGTESLPAAVTGAVFYFIAAGTTGIASPDIGKVVTFSVGGVVSGFWAVTLEAYTGASSSSPIDVIQGAFGGASSNSVTCPTLMTTQANDWAIFLGGGAAEGSGFTVPSGSTSRQSTESAADVASAISDLNGSVGAAGTSIGGGTFKCNTAANSILIGFTLGLAPLGAGPAVVARPAQQLIRAKLPQNPFRGRVSASLRSAPRNPVAGPIFHQAAHPSRAPVRAAIKGRTVFSPGSFSPAAVSSPRVFTRQIRSEPTYLVRGRVRSSTGAPLANPIRGPVIYPLRSPVRSPVPAVFSRGRFRAEPGIPAPFQGPGFRQQTHAIRAPVLPVSPRGRISSSTVMLLHAPVPFVSRTVPVRSPVAEVFSRGRKAFSLGAPLHNPVSGPVFTRIQQAIRSWVLPSRRGITTVSKTVLIPVVPPPPVERVQYPGHPVRIRPGIPSGGRIGTSRVFSSISVIPATQLAERFTSARTVSRVRGRTASSVTAAIHNPLPGPPVYPLTGPVGIAWRAPGPYRKGEVSSSLTLPSIAPHYRFPLFSFQQPAETWALGTLQSS